MPGGTNTPFGLKANGNISNGVFICLDTSTSNAALQASTSAGRVVTIGISGMGAESPPIDGAGTYHATAGNPLNEWYAEGAECLLLVGAGGWNPQDKLKPDVNGAGVTTTSDHDYYGAVALEAASAGEYGHVVVGGGYISA